MSGKHPDKKVSELESLLPYADSEEIKEFLEGLIAMDGHYRKYAKSIGVVQSSVSGRVKRLKNRAAFRGYSPEEDAAGLAPQGYVVKGKSTYYDKEGNVKGQWVKTRLDREKQIEIAKQTVDLILEGVRPLNPLPQPVTELNADLINIYHMTDDHIGMLAWGKETGKDWDLDLADKVLTSCFADMVRRSPDAESCVVSQIGDWMHYDSMVPETPTSGHILDADSRAGKMVSVACRILESLVDMALSKHKKVYLLIAEGNHDMFGSLWLRTMFRRLYRDEPRIEVVESENPYYAMQFGKNMFAWHHGHKKGLDASTALLMAARYPEIWGATEHRVMFFGDKHHKASKEFAGMTLEQLQTLAPNDAYATRSGWMSHQATEAMTYHREWGEASRVKTNPAMVGL